MTPPAYRVGPAKNNSAREELRYEINTYQMSRTEDRRKGKVAMRPRLARRLPIEEPVPQLLAREGALSGPRHVERPPLVPDPVAHKVVRARVDENAHAALEQFRDVVLRLVQRVACVPERSVDDPRYFGVVTGRAVDANDVANPVAVEEVLYIAAKSVTRVTSRPRIEKSY